MPNDPPADSPDAASRATLDSRRIPGFMMLCTMFFGLQALVSIWLIKDRPIASDREWFVYAWWTFLLANLFLPLPAIAAIFRRRGIYCAGLALGSLETYFFLRGLVALLLHR